MTKPGKPGLWKAAAALLVGGALALSGGASALAATTNPQIDPDALGSITIHKYEQPATATGLPNDGSQIDADKLTSLTPLAGVEFTVQKVPGVDVTTNKGQLDHQGLTPADAAKLVKDGGVTGVSGTTAANGEYKFDNLAVGVYYVSETVTPTGYTSAAPFLVSIPLTNPADNASWLYDVHVYPKNFKSGTDKTVEDVKTVKVGDDVVWTISSSIPLNGTDGFQVTDTLDKRLGYKSATVSLDGTALAAGDFTAATVESAKTGRTTVTVKLTESGIAKANAATGKTLEVVLTTTVKELGDGNIGNVAEVYNNDEDITNKTPSDVTPGHPPIDNDPNTPGPGDEDYDPEPDTDGEAPTVKFGEATIKKVAAEDSAVVLSGASFKVYASKADADAGTNPVFTEEFTSDDKGIVAIPALRYSNWENGVELTDKTQWRGYWLVETKSPEGYSLLTEPVEFFVTDNDSTTVNLDVNNVKANEGWTLPITGGAGTTFIMLGGGLLVAGAIVLTIRKRRTADVTA